jgi:hypothetical protein
MEGIRGDPILKSSASLCPPHCGYCEGGYYKDETCLLFLYLLMDAFKLQYNTTIGKDYYDIVNDAFLYNTTNSAL